MVWPSHHPDASGRTRLPEAMVAWSNSATRVAAASADARTPTTPARILEPRARAAAATLRDKRNRRLKLISFESRMVYR